MEFFLNDLSHNGVKCVLDVSESHYDMVLRPPETVSGKHIPILSLKILMVMKKCLVDDSSSCFLMSACTGVRPFDLFFN